jgi:predicted ATPase
MTDRTRQNGFQKLALRNWRQFDEIDLRFHGSLTVITGANGAGKTTILTLLTQHFGWNAQFLAEPRLGKTGGLKFFSGMRAKLKELTSPASPEQQRLGELMYAGGREAQAVLPEEQGGAIFSVAFQPMEPVAGVYVPSNRAPSAYQQVGQIPTSIQSPDQLITTYEDEIKTRWAGNHTQYSPTYRLKESLISLATFGYGSRVVRENAEYVETFEGFEQVLREVLPRSLKFERIGIATPEVILETGTGAFSLDAASGGITTLIDLAWRVYMRARQEPGLVVVIDEPENHLHPELQRELLPGLLRAFPEAQFIVATHNPFIVGSVPDSNVYVLRYTPLGRVRSELLDTVNKAGSSNEILRDVLGLDFTIPLWVEKRLDEIVARYQRDPVTEDSLRALRAEMEGLGLDHLFPQAVSDVLGDGT